MRMAVTGKRPINLSIDAALVDEARKYGLRLSPIAEEAIRAAVRTEAALRWREESRDALEAYNKWIEKHGVFADGIRGW